MCETSNCHTNIGIKTISVHNAVGTVLAHDITEIRQGEFKGRAFKKGHIIKKEDIPHFMRLGKERLFVLNIAEDELHEDEAAYELAQALMGKGVEIEGEPREGKINIIAGRDGLLKIDKDALLRFNMLGEVMCASLHNNTVVKKGQVVAATRAIPLVVKKSITEEAARIASQARKKQLEAAHFLTLHTRSGRQDEGGIIEVKEIRKPKAGVVITGSEVYHGRIKDAFATIISEKIQHYNGEIVGIYHAPDDESFIEERLRELLNSGADMLITTGGMSVDPDDVTRHAIRKLGATDITYGSAVLPGAMFLVAYLKRAVEQQSIRTDAKIVQTAVPLSCCATELIPVLGIPACGMYHTTTVFDLILPRILSDEKIGRKELAELGHGGLCINCGKCVYPICPFGK